jgi:hypothetical protein
VGTSWLLYFFLCDLSYNGKRFFSHNLFAAIRRWFERLLAEGQLKLELQKRLRRRLLILTGAEAALAFLALLCMFSGGFGILLSLVLVALGVWIYCLYLRGFGRTLHGWEEIIVQSSRMRNGDYSTRLELSPEHDLYYLANNLNDIQDGIQTAVDNRVKSERIRWSDHNVSHDLRAAASIITMSTCIQTAARAELCQ